MKDQRGFSLIELLVTLAVLGLIMGASYEVLDRSLRRHTSESQRLDSFQAARLAFDQVAQDIHTAGWPPPSVLTTAALVTANPTWVTQSPFAWSPNYPGTICTIGTNCTTPGAYDLIAEADIDPENDNGVEWIRYRLQGTTLSRAIVSKAGGANPATATAASLIPYVENVMNNATTAQKTAIRAAYSNMFPGNNSVPVFTYRYDPNTPCSGAATPRCITQIQVTLIVQAAQTDVETRQPMVATLTGLVVRLNPS